MSKQLLMLFNIFISTYIYTMQSPCWFNNMPTEILTHIASFLTFYDRETKQEFIERTKTIKRPTLPHCWLNRLPEEYGDEKKTLIASCPNNIMYALCYNGNKNDPNPHSALFIFDTKNDTEFYGKINCNIKNYEKLAISHNETMIATIHSIPKRSINDPSKTIPYKQILIIQNVSTKEKQTIYIPKNLLIPKTTQYPTIYFKKEGTDIIVHGIDLTCFADRKNNNPIQHHKIFPITINSSSKIDNKKTLEKYFEQRTICKNFSKQISYNTAQGLS